MDQYVFKESRDKYSIIFIFNQMNQAQSESIKNAQSSLFVTGGMGVGSKMGSMQKYQQMQSPASTAAHK